MPSVVLQNFKRGLVLSNLIDHERPLYTYHVVTQVVNQSHQLNFPFNEWLVELRQPYKKTESPETVFPFFIVNCELVVSEADTTACVCKKSQFTSTFYVKSPTF